MLDKIIEFLEAGFGPQALMQWGVVISIILLIVAVYVFFIRELSGTFNKYYEYKLERCKEAALTAARIANSDDKVTLKNAICRFDELYYGELVLVEGRDLEKAMVEFRSLIASKDENITYELVHTKRGPNPKAFRQAALKISAACYKEVTPSLFSAIVDRLNIRRRQKYQ